MASLDSTRNPLALFGRSIAAIVVVVVVGTVGFMVIDDLAPGDALYLTIVTITTVGYGDVVPGSVLGRAFAMTIVACGFGVVFYSIALFTELAVSGELGRYVGRTRMDREIQALRNHIIVCGYGRVGSIVAEELASDGHRCVIVDRDPEVSRTLTEAGGLSVQGDATSDDVLRDAGLETARCIIAATGSDAHNVYVTLSARELQPDIRIVARADDPDAESKLKRAGADRVISPNMAAGVRLALAATRPAVEGFLGLSAGVEEGADMSLEEIRLPDDSPYIGRALKDVDIRRKFDIVVVGIVRAETGETVLTPGAESTFEGNDLILALGRRQDLDRFATACAPEREETRA